MEYMDKIKKTLCKELEAMSEKSKYTLQETEYIKNISSIMKNFAKIKSEEEGYSNRGSYDMRGASFDDYSERRGRGRYAKRDSMGRYSSDGASYDSYSEEGGTPYREGMSYDGYARHNAQEHMMHKLGEMMSDASPEQRKALEECMHKLNTM